MSVVRFWVKSGQILVRFLGKIGQIVSQILGNFSQTLILSTLEIGYQGILPNIKSEFEEENSIGFNPNIFA